MGKRRNSIDGCSAPKHGKPNAKHHRAGGVMVGIATVGLMLVAPAAPVPALPPMPAPKADRFKAQEFARLVYQTGEAVQGRYVKPVEMKNLIDGAVRGLYEECGLTVPDRVQKAVRGAIGATEL